MSLAEVIKKIRQETSAGVMDIKKALDEADGDEKKAKEILLKSGAQKAAKKAGRSANQGIIEAYSHNGKIGILVEVNCETDFVARNSDFIEFTHNVALQVAAMMPNDVTELLGQEFIKDTSKTIQELLHELIGIIGEKIEIKRFVIYQLGK